jgi:glucuronate isomerase
MNQERGMVTQIHYGAFRNANEYLFKSWGTDVGGDVSLDTVHIVENLIPLLSKFFSGESPHQSHLVLYPMNQTYAHVNLMLERAFANVHAGNGTILAPYCRRISAQIKRWPCLRREKNLIRRQSI